MAKPIRVRIVTKEEQEEKFKMIVELFLVTVLGFLLYLSYNYIRGLGFNHNSAIVLMVSFPLILLIFIFRGKKIYWAVRSLSQDKYYKRRYKKQDRKGFFWLSIIGLLLVIILFFQYSSSISNYINISFETSKNLKAENSFIELAKNKGYPKPNTLSKDEGIEICTLKCNSNSMKLNSHTETLSFNVIKCVCSNIDFLRVTSGQQTEVKTGHYYVDVKTLKELTREEFLIRIGK